MNLLLRTTQFKEYSAAVNSLLQANSAKEIDKHLRVGATIIQKQAKANIRGLKNSSGTTKGNKSRRGDYGMKDDFARSITIKKSKAFFRVKIGPSQDKLNTLKTVKWKGQQVPAAHWKELGTQGRSGMKAAFPVFRAYKQKGKEARRASLLGLFRNMKTISDKKRVLKFAYNI
jgi:hypothetical protein